MHIAGSFISCGIQELFGLYNRDAGLRRLANPTKETLEQSRQWLTGNYPNRYFPDQKLVPFQSYIFSDNDGSGNGIAIAQYIRANSLGQIIEIGPWRNPNSGNQIRAWLWVYNGAQLPPEKKV